MSVRHPTNCFTVDTLILIRQLKKYMTRPDIQCFVVTHDLENIPLYLRNRCLSLLNPGSTHCASVFQTQKKTTPGVYPFL